MAGYFTDDLYRFLRGLKRNNDKDWFAKHKPKYEEHVKRAAFRFIEDFAPHLDNMSPSFRAEAKANGGSLFRIYRDTRFSKDKTPYKTHVGIHFRHRAAKDAHAPGFYLHLEPTECFVGVGIWRPEPKVAAKIRNAIGASPVRWKKAAYDKKFQRRFGLAGDSLKRLPKAFDNEHPYVDDLKRKDFIAIADIPVAATTKPGFLVKYVKDCTLALPLMEFLCDAVGVDF